MRHGVLLTFLAGSLVACQHREASPWRWLELGTVPLSEALTEGKGVTAEVQELAENEHAGWPFILWATDPTTQIVQRELQGMPSLTCGDLIRLHPKNLPLSIQQAFDWNDNDSLTVRWRCLDQNEIARMGADHVARSKAPRAAEWEWWQALKHMSPDAFQAPAHRFAVGDPIQLRIITLRPDGNMVGDTVKMAFHQGEPDQVVPALASFLSVAGPGASARVWSTSDQAFGSQAHPEWGLPAHTPVQFVVEAY